MVSWSKLSCRPDSSFPIGLEGLSSTKGVRAPFFLGCEESGGHGCDTGPADVGVLGDGGLELSELFPPVARTKGEDGGSGDRVK